MEIPPQDPWLGTLHAYVPRHARVVPPAAHHVTRRKQVPVDTSRKLRVMAPAAALLRAAADIPQPNLPRQVTARPAAHK